MRKLGRFLVAASLALTADSVAFADERLATLGKVIFFDTTLSEPPGQACASCHGPAAGWTGPHSDINARGAVYEGAVQGRFGNRKPPSAAYATFSPPLRLDAAEDHFVGGNFWDGRATGWLLGNPAADKAQGPFLNPVEHNLAGAEDVVRKVCDGVNGDHFRCAPYPATRSEWMIISANTRRPRFATWICGLIPVS
jgi:cytochrome c peroxidase